MAALTNDRNTPHRDGKEFSFPAATAKKFFAGAIVVIQTDGYAAPGRTALGLKTVGVAVEQVDNSAGANGDVAVKVRRGCFQFKQGADPVALADVGSACYLVDDQTVAKTSGTNTRSIAGIVRDVAEGKVWVEF